VLSVVTFAVLIAATIGWAAEPSAQDILNSITGSRAFTGSGQATVELTITNKQGKSKVQSLDIYRSDDKGTISQLVVFNTPADVKGTKFLSITASGKESQMWLYLPALGRERVIAGSAVEGAFMGTDFSFAEISGDVSFSKEYTAKRLADKKIEGLDCYMLQLTPRSAKSTYSYVNMAVHKTSRVPLSVEFYNKSKKLVKKLNSSDLRKNSKGEWQPYEITMSNVSTGSTTKICLLKVSEAAVSADVFTLRYLRR